jgi:predicted amidohydrolase YtcJ
LIHAAVERRTDAGRVLVPGERIPARRALDLLLGSPDTTRTAPRRIEVGGPADVCILHEPLRVALEHLPANPVRITIAAGVVSYDSSGLSG